MVDPCDPKMIDTEKTLNFPKIEPASNLTGVEHVYLRTGSLCPKCAEGHMDYNGMLDLECSHCGYSLVSAGAGCG